MVDTPQGNANLVGAMSRQDFCRLKDLIYEKCGIKITDAKKTMLETRLQKRLKTLQMASFEEYCDYLFGARGDDELPDMINQVTTNKTDFFREPAHFRYLTDTLLPQLMQKNRSVAVWSAGCSSGEEPYTLAMVLAEAGCNFTVTATDISTKVLDKARLAIYDEERVAPVAQPLKRKYLMASRDRTRRLYRVVPELRQRVRFRRLNFMDTDFGFRSDMDIIFCRNVIIYFDRETQERLLNKFCTCLAPHGHIFMGHSETLMGMNVPLEQVAPTIYRKAR
jgi:chemotaxis protein methyltransferase CheR